MPHNHDPIKKLYLEIDRIIKRNKEDNIETNLEDLKKELKREFNFLDRCENGSMLGHVLLWYAVDNANLSVVKFLLENEVAIINIAGNRGATDSYYISKTKRGRAILCSCLDDSNAEVLKMLLQNINIQQSKLKPESTLYRLYQQLKDNALFTSVVNNRYKAVELLIEFGANPTAKDFNNHTVLDIAREKGDQKIITLLGFPEEEIHHTMAGSETSSGETERITESVNPSQHIGLQPFNAVESKYRENRKDFLTSLGKDCVGIAAIGLLITVSVISQSVTFTIVFSILAALVAVGTSLHAKNSTLPSYREMKETQAEFLDTQPQNRAASI